MPVIGGMPHTANRHKDGMIDDAHLRWQALPT